MRVVALMAARAARFCLLLSVLMLAASCSTLQYDQTADSAITKLQSTIHLKINNWISGVSPLAYTNADNLKFYDQAESDLTALEQRMESIPDPATQKLPIIFSDISQLLSSMRTLHQKKGTLSSYYLQATQAQIDAPFAALLTFELSLKAGTGAGSQSTSTNKASASPKS
jgi:ABC-type transport system involved in cytochrome bd biosynthesis fused ATPase/permease subunit